MAEAIKELINDKTLANSLVDKAFLTVRKHYDINVVGKKLVSLLHKIKTHESQHHKAKHRPYDSHI